MYRNKDIPNELMELVKSRYMVHKKNGMGFFKQKLISCYKLRVGEELVNKFNMQTSMAEIEQVKEARLARLEDERRQRQAAQEEDERRQRERETEERIQREVEERVQREIRERTRQEAILLSPERRRRGGHTGQVGATTTYSQNKHVGEFLYFKLPKLSVQVKSRAIKDVTKYVLNTDVQFTN